jgi:hypothetical protein
MLIDEACPRIVAGKAPMRERWPAEAAIAGLDEKVAERLFSLLPPALATAECFLDRLTNLWRYEFGLPFSIGEHQKLLGTHMWQPVRSLVDVVSCAAGRLSQEQQRTYFDRLARIEKHEDVLVEFLPVLHLKASIHADFEFPTGVGNRDVDWRILPPLSPPVLIDVKNRRRDLIEFIEQIDSAPGPLAGEKPAPVHDVSLLFRSIEVKFAAAHPDTQLQGAWISTELQQEEEELEEAFLVLDKEKVHFTVLGGWEPGLTILARRESDKALLCNLFGEEDSGKFRFKRGSR